MDETERTIELNVTLTSKTRLIDVTSRVTRNEKPVRIENYRIKFDESNLDHKELIAAIDRILLFHDGKRI